MVDPAAAELLRRAIIVRVATVDEDGAPRVAPFWLSFDGERIYLDTLENRTVRNLRRDPRVAVLVDEGLSFDELKGALVHGTARLWSEESAPEHVTAGIEALRALHAEETSTPEFEAYLAQETRDVVLVEILPERTACWDLAVSRPSASPGR